MARGVLTPRRVHAGWSLVVIAGCAYRANSFDAWGHDFRGVRASVDCLDLAVEWRHEPAGDPVLAYVFGNRCDGPVTVDLAGAAVIGRAATTQVALVPYDPQHELRPLPLDGRSVGEEAIEYRGGSSDALLTICVDAGAIAGAATTTWQCVGNPVAGGPR